MTLRIEPYGVHNFDTAVSLFHKVTESRDALPQYGVIGWRGEQAVGLAAVFRYEGLPHLTAVVGGVLPAYRRCGYGTQLLTAVVRHFILPTQELSILVKKWDSPGGCFLRQLGFALEHEEIIFARPATRPLPPLVLPPGFRLVTNETVAKAHLIFAGLYRQAFAPHPWYQPFEVTKLPPDLPGMLFLYHGSRPIGFAWTRTWSEGGGWIEPFGIIPSYQGQGHGRVLLTAALSYLQKKHEMCHIITWSNNEPAQTLYRQLGFTAVGTHYYLNKPASALLSKDSRPCAAP